MALYGGDKAALSALAANKNQMTKEEFMEWLKKFDLNKDGKISREELRAAIISCGNNLNTASNPTVNDSNRNVKINQAPTWSAKGSEQDNSSVQEFKKWLMKFDKDKDGRISKDELCEAMRSRGVWFFPGCRAGRKLREADTNRSGYIDDEKEIQSLLGFAERTLGFKFK